ncbi:hypothetical protein BCV70DRAFT_51446 [Testicularia cyperi]|uniref:Transmembrane protein n=1 Tax=Testicularia cyperi TaxID=1882483 RepID=A0A317XU52_9BASI|nr:hypothetical protein BCV70DRAFT_51446 [Testicularia cyperi]
MPLGPGAPLLATIVACSVLHLFTLYQVCSQTQCLQSRQDRVHSSLASRPKRRFLCRLRALSSAQRLQILINLLDLIGLLVVPLLFRHFFFPTSGHSSAVQTYLFDKRDLARCFSAILLLTFRPAVLAALASSSYLFILRSQSPGRWLLTLSLILPLGLSGLGTAVVACKPNQTPHLVLASFVFAVQMAFALVTISVLSGIFRALVQCVNNNGAIRGQTQLPIASAPPPQQFSVPHPCKQPTNLPTPLEHTRPDDTRDTFGCRKTAAWATCQSSAVQDFEPLHTQLCTTTEQEKPHIRLDGTGTRVPTSTGTSSIAWTGREGAGSLGLSSAIASSTNPYGTHRSYASNSPDLPHPEIHCPLSAARHLRSRSSEQSQRLLMPPGELRTQSSWRSTLTSATSIDARHHHHDRARLIGGSSTLGAVSSVSLRLCDSGFLPSVSSGEPSPRGVHATATIPSSESRCSSVVADPLFSQSEIVKPCIRLVGLMLSSWISMPMSAPLLFRKPGPAAQAALDIRAFLFCLSFCGPAFMLVVEKLALLVWGCIERQQRRRASRGKKLHQDSARSSYLAHSTKPQCIVDQGILPGFSQAKDERGKRRHNRSKSYTFGVARNGYDSLGEEVEVLSSRKSLSSLSALSVKSVPFSDRHWRAGKVVGDRVVSSRSSLVRGLNLALHPRPKLEVLPQAHAAHESGLDRKQHRASKQTSTWSWSLQWPLEAADGSEGQRVSIADRVESQHIVAGKEHSEGNEERRGVEASQSSCTWIDDTPGCPRLRTDHVQIEMLDQDLASPTKQRILPERCEGLGGDEEEQCAMVSIPLDRASDGSGLACSLLTGQIPIGGFSASATSNNSVSLRSQSRRSLSRLFSEVMELVARAPRANGPESIASSPKSLQNRSPKGYQSIEEMQDVVRHLVRPVDAENATGGGRDEAVPDGSTVVIHSISDDPSNPSPSASASSSLVHLSRADSASSTLSSMSYASSLSSRLRFSSQRASTPLRSARVPALSGGHEKPSAGASTGTTVKKMRSRTFASAFGIELSTLRTRRVDSDGKVNLPAISTDSPSWSSSGCPSTLSFDLDLSLSPLATKTRIEESRATDAQTDEALQVSRSDQKTDTVAGRRQEERDSFTTALNSAQTDWESPDGASGQTTWLSRLSGGDVASVEVSGISVDDIDTDNMHEAGRSECAPNLGACETAMGGFADRASGVFDLHTIDEEEEGYEETHDCDDCDDCDDRECERSQPPESQMHGRASFSSQRSSTSEPSSQPTSLAESCTDAAPMRRNQEHASRQYLLEQQEAVRRANAMKLHAFRQEFPERALSVVEERTELPTLSRISTEGLDSQTGGCRPRGSDSQSTTASRRTLESLVLGSLVQSMQSLEEEDAVETVDAAEEGRDTAMDDSSCAGSLHAFVTMRTERRTRAAAFKLGQVVSDAGAISNAENRSREQEQVQEQVTGMPQVGVWGAAARSSECRGARLSELGLDQGIWAESPVHLALWSNGGACEWTTEEERRGCASPSVESSDSYSGEAGYAMVSHPTPSPLRKQSLLARSDVRRSVSAAAQAQKIRRRLSASVTLSLKAGHSTSCVTGASGAGADADASSATAAAVVSGSSLLLLGGGGGVRRRSLMKREVLRSPRDRIEPSGGVSRKKPRKTRSRGVAVFLGRNRFTVVDEDDSWVRAEPTVGSP